MVRNQANDPAIDAKGSQKTSRRRADESPFHVLPGRIQDHGAKRP
jgi:hypothetical protein